jgi:hypothetical protein
VSISLPKSYITGRPRARGAALAAGVALACAGAVAAVSQARADTPPPSIIWPSPRPHAVGDVFNYAVRGTMSAEIDGHDAFGRSIHQEATPTLLLGRERIAIKTVSTNGVALHRSGSIVATFKGKSSPPQSGSGWTLVTPSGIVEDRKGSTLGGLFLLPLGFLGDEAVDGGAPFAVGDHWKAKLGVALFGMTARPMMDFKVVGTRGIFGATVYTLAATGTAPILEPIVTNDDIAMGNARGTAHVTLHCDYDPHLMRVVSMEIDVADEIRVIARAHAPSGVVRDRQHYLVAMDEASIQAESQSAATPAPTTQATPPPG